MAEKKSFNDLLRQGTFALQRGQHNTALTFLEKAYRLRPDDPDLLLNLSGALILAKKFKRARRLLEQLVKMEPQNAMVWTNLGAAYLGNPVLAGQKDQNRALDAFKTALDIQPQAPNVAYNIGLIYRDQKAYSEAIVWFQEALVHNPGDTDARYHITKLEEKLNGSDEEGEEL